MTALLCITSTMALDPIGEDQVGPRVRPCTERDLHLETCADDDCRGCYPRAAEFGCLCAHCYEKAADALRRVGSMILHLRSIETSGQALAERVATSMQARLLTPESWRVADELLAALTGRAIPSTATLDDTQALIADAEAEWSDLRAVASTEDGARAAVVVTLTMRTALRRWPEAEAEVRAIPKPIRCAECKELALYRHAPLEYLGDIYVECAACGARSDWWSWAAKTKHLATAVDDARKREEKERQKARKEARG